MRWLALVFGVLACWGWILAVLLERKTRELSEVLERYEQERLAGFWGRHRTAVALKRLARKEKQ